MNTTDACISTFSTSCVGKQKWTLKKRKPPQETASHQGELTKTLTHIHVILILK